MWKYFLVSCSALVLAFNLLLAEAEQTHAGAGHTGTAVEESSDSHRFAAEGGNSASTELNPAIENPPELNQQLQPLVDLLAEFNPHGSDSTQLD